MAKYQIIELNGVSGASCVKREDGALIPMDENNPDYQEYLEWKKSGNTPDPTPVFTVSVDNQRKTEYNKRGATIEAMTVALWEKIMEDRPETADSLQLIRSQVKKDIPKA